VKKTKSVVKKKPAAKAKAKAPAKKAAAKPKAKAPAKAPVKKAAAKTAAKTPAKTAKPAVKAAAKAPVPAKPTAKVVAAPVKAGKTTAAKIDPKAAAVKDPKAAKAAAKDAKAGKGAPPAAPVDLFPALEGNIKRPAKPFFLEVKPGVERVIKRGDKSAVSQVIDLQARRKGPAAEETPEELAERIERELQSQSFLKRAPMRPQMCTKCGINAVTPRFTIDRELGYCEFCAEILHLGETKEARRMEFNLAVKKEEGEAAEPDEVPPEEADEEPVPEDLDV
jgi:hypothetical protein